MYAFEQAWLGADTQTVVLYNGKRYRVIPGKLLEPARNRGYRPEQIEIDNRPRYVIAEKDIQRPIGEHVLW